MVGRYRYRNVKSGSNGCLWLHHSGGVWSWEGGQSQVSKTSPHKTCAGQETAAWCYRFRQSLQVQGENCRLWKHAAECQKEMTNRAEVPDAFFTRCILAMVVLKTFCLTVLEANAVFLYASLPEDEPPVTVSPPGLLKRLGLAAKVNYGSWDRLCMACACLQNVGQRHETTQSAVLKCSSQMEKCVFFSQQTRKNMLGCWFVNQEEL